MRELSWLLSLGVPLKATQIAEGITEGHKVLSHKTELLLILHEKAKDDDARHRQRPGMVQG